MSLLDGHRLERMPVCAYCPPFMNIGTDFWNRSYARFDSGDLPFGRAGLFFSVFRKGSDRDGGWKRLDGVCGGDLQVVSQVNVQIGAEVGQGAVRPEGLGLKGEAGEGKGRFRMRNQIAREEERGDAKR